MGWVIQHYGFRAAFGVAAALSAFALPYFLIVDRSSSVHRGNLLLPSHLDELPRSGFKL